MICCLLYILYFVLKKAISLCKITNKIKSARNLKLSKSYVIDLVRVNDDVLD